jgi:hypothetical protein
VILAAAEVQSQSGAAEAGLVKRRSRALFRRGFWEIRLREKSIGAWNYVDFAALKLHKAVAEGEESVIAADADVVAGEKLRAALADYDAACRDRFAAVRLYAAELRIAVAVIAGRPAAFFVCHFETLRRRILTGDDFRYFHREMPLAMPDFAMIVLSPAVLVRNQLLVFYFGFNFGGHFCVRDKRVADFHRFSAHEKDVGELNLVAGLRVAEFNINPVARGDFVLASTVLNDRVH